MSDRSRMKFHICAARGGQGRENTGGSSLTADGVGNITNLFIKSYRNSKESDRAKHKFPGGNADTTPTGAIKHSKQRNKPHSKNE